MAAGVLIKHKRKAGIFADGELAAGEWGLDTTNNVWYYSVTGTTVVALVTGSSSSPSGSYTPGSVTILTGNWRLQVKRLQLTSTQRLSIAGTGRMSISN